MSYELLLPVSLPSELQHRIGEAVASGKYQSASEVMCAALRLLFKAPSNQSRASEGDTGLHERDQQLVAMFSQATAGIAQTDLTGRFLRANDRYCAIVGRSREELLQLRMQDITHTDDLPQNAILFHQSVEKGQPFEIEKRYVRPDGSVIWASTAVSPLRGRSGAIEGTVGICIDSTARKNTESALQDSQRRLNAVLDNASVAIFLMNEHQQCVYMNAAAEHLTGYTLAETQGRNLHDVVHHTRPDGSHYPREACPIDRAFPDNNQMQGEETFVHKNGSFYPVAFTASPIRDERSHTIGTIIEVRDIRHEKEAERRQELLINELNHRVKNTLATVQSIATQTLRNASSPEQAKADLEARLLALSRAHDVLTRENWQGASLREIIDRAVEPYNTRGESRLHRVGPQIRLPPRMALALTMALQELATNAVKYGALSNETGRISIAWSLGCTTSPHLNLRWEESGGPKVSAPARRGFGTRLIERSLASDLGGEAKIEFATTGLVCTVSAPLPSDQIVLW